VCGLAWRSVIHCERFRTVPFKLLKPPENCFVFGVPDSNSAWGGITVVSGRLFTGSQNGTVYSLDFGDNVNLRMILPEGFAACVLASASTSVTAASALRTISRADAC
jgi:hypothetical protein